MAVEHYENFPVASLLLPRNLRHAVAVIYAFARSADDIADEGDATPEQRGDALAAYRVELDRIGRGDLPRAPLFRDLAQVVSRHQLSLEPFHDLLSAFEQDITTVRYATFDALLDYCRRSADPVGRIMLQLYGQDTDLDRHQSDGICSALQLTNFLQDVAIDWKKGRIYLPLEDLARFGVSESDIGAGRNTDAWQALMRFQLERTRTMMLSGAPLAVRLPGRAGWELRLIVQGGLRIIERIEQVEGNVFRHRPVLASADWLRMAWRSMRMHATLPAPEEVG